MLDAVQPPCRRAPPVPCVCPVCARALQPRSYPMAPCVKARRAHTALQKGDTLHTRCVVRMPCVHALHMPHACGTQSGVRVAAGQPTLPGNGPCVPRGFKQGTEGPRALAECCARFQGRSGVL